MKPLILQINIFSNTLECNSHAEQTVNTFKSNSSFEVIQ